MVPFQETLIEHPWIVTYLAAAMVCVLVHPGDIKILIKAPNQRTASEKTQIERGVGRSFFLELLLFVNVSTTLMLLLFLSYLPVTISNAHNLSWYALLGIGSYGFPYATLRRAIQRTALKILSEFHAIATSNAEPGTQGTTEAQQKEDAKGP